MLLKPSNQSEGTSISSPGEKPSLEIKRERDGWGRLPIHEETQCNNSAEMKRCLNKSVPQEQIVEEKEQPTPPSQDGIVEPEQKKQELRHEEQEEPMDGGQVFDEFRSAAAQASLGEGLPDIQLVEESEQQILKDLRDAQKEARRLAIDATGRLQGTISEIFEAAKVLNEFRYDLYEWENRFCGQTFDDLAMFVRRYWFMKARLNRLVSDLTESCGDLRLLDRAQNLSFETEDNSRLLERACASLGLSLIIPKPGDAIDEDRYRLLVGDFPSNTSGIFVKSCISPGVARTTEEGDDLIIRHAFVEIQEI